MTNRSTDSLNRAAQPTRFDRSHGRTDGRTDVDALPRDLNTDHLSARARVQEFQQWLEGELDANDIGTGGRWPVIRSGERDEIPWHTRCAVYYRDNATCQLCGTFRPETTHLDHLIPWSAGGSDKSDNLRVLCEPCNMRRGNANDGTHRIRKRPVTWWCARCYHPDREWLYHGNWESRDRYCNAAADTSFCRVTRVGKGDDRWHEADPVDPTAASSFAFCAHCNTYGYTEPRCLL